MSYIIECNDFSFYYGSRRVLDRINFSLEQGEWLSIIGANGSGKSTLLKNIFRLIPGRHEGEIRILGRKIESYSQKELAKIMSYVPQAGSRIPPFTVRDFVKLSRYAVRSDDSLSKNLSQERIEWALEATGMSQFSLRRLDQLSGGQRQRAFLAAALAQPGSTLLLDEPSSFLDPSNTIEMFQLLKSLHTTQSFTIIIVTHDLSLPLDAGGKTLVLCEGEQFFFGRSDELVGQKVMDRAFIHDFSYLKNPKTGKTVVVA